MWRLITHRDIAGDLEPVVEGDLLDSFADKLRAYKDSQLSQGIKHREKLHSYPLFSALSYSQAQYHLWRLNYHDFL